MPVITIDLAAIDRETKATLAKELTATASAITGISGEKFIVLIKELDRDNIGIGGVLLSDLLPPQKLDRDNIAFGGTLLSDLSPSRER